MFSKKLLAVLSVVSLCSCSPVDTVLDDLQTEQETYCIGADVSDRYDINLAQYTKYSEGLETDYFYPAEFDSVYSAIRSQDKNDFDTGVYFDAALCYFFNQNSNEIDDWLPELWYSGTDSEVEYIYSFCKVGK